MHDDDPFLESVGRCRHGLWRHHGFDRMGFKLWKRVSPRSQDFQPAQPQYLHLFLLIHRLVLGQGLGAVDGSADPREQREAPWYCLASCLDDLHHRAVRYGCLSFMRLLSSAV